MIEGHRDPVIDRAIEAAGTPTKLAEAAGVRLPSIYSWRRIPSGRVLAIERATGISRQELRPDLYPRELIKPSEAAD